MKRRKAKTMSKEIKSNSEKQQRIVKNMYKKLKVKHKNETNDSRTDNSDIAQSKTRGSSSSLDTDKLTRYWQIQLLKYLFLDFFNYLYY